LIGLPKKFVDKLDRLSSRSAIKYGIYLTAVALFFALILIPTLLGILIKWGTLWDFFGDSELLSGAVYAVRNSFVVAIVVSALDVADGVPMAWLIARSRSAWINVLDALADVPLHSADGCAWIFASPFLVQA
jgi:ABC-type sulfate transport system permease component